jgi:Rap1a immunity proteins
MPTFYNRLKLVAAGISVWALCVATAPTYGHAAVTEDEFLVRTTGDLVDLCKAVSADPYYTAAINFCHGFSVGVYRVLEAENEAKPRRMFCVPEPAPHRADAIAGFVQWMDANPDEKTHAPADGIAAYLQKQFPCGHGK